MLPIVRSPIRIVHLCARMCARACVCVHRGRGEGWTDGSRPCLARPIRAYRRIIYSNGASLAAPTATRPDRPTDFRHDRPYVHLCFLLFFVGSSFLFFFLRAPLSLSSYSSFYGSIFISFFFWFWFWFGLEGGDWRIFFFSLSFFFLVFLLLGGFSLTVFFSFGHYSSSVV